MSGRSGRGGSRGSRGNIKGGLVRRGGGGMDKRLQAMEKRMERAQERELPGAAQERKERNRAKAAKEKETADARKCARGYLEGEGTADAWISKLQQAGGMFATAAESVSVGVSGGGGLSVTASEEPVVGLSWCPVSRSSTAEINTSLLAPAEPSTPAPSLRTAADGVVLLKRAHAEAAAKEMSDWLAAEGQVAEAKREAEEKVARKRKRKAAKAAQQRKMLSFSPDEQVHETEEE